MVPEKFWAKVRKAGPDDCWEWVGPIQKCNGRPYYAINRVTMNASRALWILANGPITGNGQTVNHTCDNGRCCNPAHLYLGTQALNMADKYGTWHLDEEAQTRIVLAARSGEPKARIAKRYGVHVNTITRILDGSRLPAPNRQLAVGK